MYKYTSPFIALLLSGTMGMANVLDGVPLAPTTRLGEGFVVTIDFSPDGTLLAVAHGSSPGEERRVVLWDPQTQEQVALIEGRYRTMSFSPDGSLLALGGPGNTILLWSVASQTELGVWSLPSGTIDDIAFSPDGNILASCGGWMDPIVRLWDVGLREQIGSWQANASEVWSIAFSPDGLLATGGVRADSAIGLWDVASQTRVGELPGHLARTTDLAFSADGSLLASADVGSGNNRAAFLWDMATQSQVGLLGGHPSHVGSVAFSPDGSILATTSNTAKQIYLWDVQTQSLMVHLTGHDGSVGNDEVTFSSDGKWLACGSNNGVELWQVDLPGADGNTASLRHPSRGAEDVPRDVVLSWAQGDASKSHHLYFGIDANAVETASLDNPLGVLASQGQADAFFQPVETLAFGQRYYWRVDKVNGPPDYAVTRGQVWGFTVELQFYPVTSIAATASSSNGILVGPEKTIDGSGLDALDQHSREGTDMWLSGAGDSDPWIQYEFDGLYKLHEMWVWNSNQRVELIVGRGAKEVTIEYSTNGIDWRLLENVRRFSRASGRESYAHNTTVEFGGALARYVRINIQSGWGSSAQVGLSEVRFYHVPVFPWDPKPVPGATIDDLDIALKWHAGREADFHEVSLSSDRAAVADGMAIVGITHEALLDLSDQDIRLDTTYYWMVNEVNEAEDPNHYVGDIWSFTTPEFLVVDDMESYRNREFFEIWATWIDGLDDPANGSQVGNGPTGTPETSVVHDGRQSLPIHFSNARVSVSETTRTLSQPQDWTQSGIQTLVLHFATDTENRGNGRIYMKLNDTKAVFPEDLSSLAPNQWIQWKVDLPALGVDLTEVRTLTIGIEGPGARGVIYVDGIRLYAASPPIPAP